jgi:hypothetical protein
MASAIHGCHSAFPKHINQRTKDGALRMKFIAIAILIGISTARGMPRIEALSQIESGDNDLAHGHAGEISRFQLLKSVWRAHTDLPYSAATNGITAMEVAMKIIQERTDNFIAQHGRTPTDAEWYKMWNPRCSKATAQRFQNLCQSP